VNKKDIDAQTWNQLADEIIALRLENTRLRALQAKPERDLIYIASPYGGKHENYTRAQRDMMILTETYRQYDFISPIVSYGFCYDNYSYDDGIRQCLGLLAHCDQLWILHDDGVSRGVKIEREFAIKHNIPIKECAENF
jgi:hypothetical protein